MVNCSESQSASNMLRRMIIVLPVCGFLAICSCTVIRQDVYTVATISSNCNGDDNSTACATRAKEIVTDSDKSSFRVSRGLQNLMIDDENESGRKKKGKGHGKLLLYLLGAAKVMILHFVLKAIAAIAGKALVVGKVALAMVTALALKKSADHKEKVSYEIVKHPHHSYEHSHSSSIDFDHNELGEVDFGYRKRRKTRR